MILLVPLTLLAVTVANRSNIEEWMAGAHRDGQQSMMNAESGLAMAHEVLTQVVDGSYGHSLNEILDPNDQAGGLVYEGASLTGYVLSEGTVTVEVRDNDDGDADMTTDSDSRVVVRSTGSYRSGERIVEGVYQILTTPPTSTTGGPEIAIFAETNLTINGNPFIHGEDGSIHTNSDLVISGNPIITGDVTASGDVDISGDPVDGDGDPITVEANSPRIETPYIYPPVYKPYATLYFTADCDVYDGWPTEDHNRLQRDVKDNPDWNGWNCDYNKEWKLDGSDHIEGFIYVEGNVIISSNPGEGEDEAVTMSIIAEGYIEISGNPNLQPYPVDLDPTDPVVIELLDGRDNVLFNPSILFYAGNDLKINGNPEQSLTGVMAAHMEFDISGNPILDGTLIAENGRAQEAQGYGSAGQEIRSGRDVKNMVDHNAISGNPDIETNPDGTGDPDPSGGTPDSILVEAWREVVE